MEEKDETYAAVLHYQKNLMRYSEKGNDEKMIYCIKKLEKLPVTLAHLQETGVGKTVNSMKRLGGEVAKVAGSVVQQWKEMVETEQQRQKQQIEEEEGYESDVRESPKYKEKEHRHKHESSERHSKHSKSTSSSHGDSSKSRKELDEKLKSSKESKIEHKSRHSEKEIKSSSSEKENKEKSKRDKHEESKPERNYSHSSSKKDKKDKEKHKETPPKDDREHRASDESRKSSKSKHKEENGSSSKQKTSKEAKEVENDSSFLKRHHSEAEDVNKDKHSPKKRKNVKNSFKDLNDGIDGGSGTSFAEALGMLVPSCSRPRKREKVVESPLPENSSGKQDSPVPSKKSKLIEESWSPPSPNNKPIDIDKTPPLLANPAKLEPLDVNISSLLPEITPNYRPLGTNYHDAQSLKMKRMADDEALSAVISSKTQRTKVYSGNKIWGKVSTLFDLCIRVLQDNIDALEYTGGVPYSILKPVLDRCTPDQLFMMEHHNPYLMEDTDELWKFHCQKDFRTKKREEMETWRDMYMRCLDEREAKLRVLTSNIKQSQQEKSLPVRQTKLAYVDSVAKPPRNIARKQAKNGIDNKPTVTPAARLTALATSGEAGKVSVPNPVAKAASASSSGSSNHSSLIKPKKAPLMQKTLALIKSRFRR